MSSTDKDYKKAEHKIFGIILWKAVIRTSHALNTDLVTA
jgi:hypothetical protein